jgi:hypothetical protein
MVPEVKAEMQEVPPATEGLKVMQTMLKSRTSIAWWLLEA